MHCSVRFNLLERYRKDVRRYVYSVSVLTEQRCSTDRAAYMEVWNSAETHRQRAAATLARLQMHIETHNCAPLLISEAQVAA